MQDPRREDPAPTDDPAATAPAEAPPPAHDETLMALWERHRRTILTAVSAALIVVLAFQIAGALQRAGAEALAREYGALATTAERVAFAERHPGATLGGLAALQAGQELAGEAKWGDAVTQFGRARTALRSHALETRARLALATALYRLEPRRAEALAEWKALADDTSALDSFRAEAAYQLAVDALAGQRWAEAKAALDRVAGLGASAAGWKARADQLRELLPAG